MMMIFLSSPSSNSMIAKLFMYVVDFVVVDDIVVVVTGIVVVGIVMI